MGQKHIDIDIGCVSIQGTHPSKDALYEGAAFVDREGQTEGRTNVFKCKSGLRNISSLRNKPLTPFTLRDDTPLLSPSNAVQTRRRRRNTEPLYNNYIKYNVNQFNVIWLVLMSLNSDKVTNLKLSQL